MRNWIVSALVLLAGGVLLLWYADDLKEAAGAAGFALLGGAVVRVLDGSSAEREETRRAEEKRRRDLNETRRVLYIALATAPGDERGSAETGGTLANALAHHYGVLTIQEAEALASGIVYGPTRTESMEKLRKRIREITKELGEEVR